MLEGAVSDQWFQSTVQGEAQKLAARSGEPVRLGRPDVFSRDMMGYVGCSRHILG